jgi:hypothetical protein
MGQQKIRPTSAEAARFNKLFGTTFTLYWDNLMGFNTDKFEEFIQPDEDKSIDETILLKFGEEALVLVHSFLDYVPVVDYLNNK